jgi:hypothetical protein
MPSLGGSGLVAGDAAETAETTVRMPITVRIIEENDKGIYIVAEARVPI